MDGCNPDHQASEESDDRKSWPGGSAMTREHYHSIHSPMKLEAFRKGQTLRRLYKRPMNSLDRMHFKNNGFGNARRAITYGEHIFLVLGCFFFVFQSGAVFLAICCIFEPTSLICMLFVAFWSQNLWFAFSFWLLAFGCGFWLLAFGWVLVL